MKTLKGIPVSSGFALGTICLYSGELEGALPHYGIMPENINAEKERLIKAFEVASGQMQDMVKKARDGGDRQAVEIFNTHLMILNDVSLKGKIQGLIESNAINAEHAVNDVFEEYISRYEKMEGHFRELTHDFIDTRNRVLGTFNLGLGKFKCPVGDTKPVIVAARQLTPSMVLNFQKENVLAFIAAEGGITSHATILARSFGVPIVFGINVGKELDCGVQAIVDGSLGKIITDPDTATLEYYGKKIEGVKNKQKVCAIRKGSSARTKSGKRIKLKVNISTPAELDMLGGLVHDGIGLLRTEFLFAGRKTPPSENEQYRMYEAVLKQMRDHPVTVRLLDFGADKLPSYFNISIQGTGLDLDVRGAMIVESFPEIYITQLKALLRANTGKNLRLLYPMVSDPSDLKTYRDALQNAKESLIKEKTVFNPDNILEGVMIETPAAVMLAENLMEEIDFINIGSNDLLQYTLAASRSNQLAEKRYHVMHPALVKFLEIIAKSGKKAKKEVCLCGEISSFEEYYRVLLETGLDTFSVAVSKFEDIKCELLHIDMAKGNNTLKEYYKMGNKEDVDRYFAKFA